jgi:hypothetical protein
LQIERIVTELRAEGMTIRNKDLAAAAPPHHPKRRLLREPHNAGIRLSRPGGSLITSRPSPARSRGSIWRAIRYRMKSRQHGIHTFVTGVAEPVDAGFPQREQQQ